MRANLFLSETFHERSAFIPWFSVRVSSAFNHELRWSEIKLRLLRFQSSLFRFSEFLTFVPGASRLLRLLLREHSLLLLTLFEHRRTHWAAHWTSRIFTILMMLQ